MTDIVKARHLVKRYGDFRALDDCSFNIPEGAICGLIGPNGAGKTTTLKALIGLCDVEGSLEVAGRDPASARHKLMEDVCFIADVGILPGWLRVSQILDYVEGVHPNFSRARAENYLASTEIPQDKKIKELSKGMVTQLHLALVMAIQVRLLVLDEPTLGLDILYRKDFYDRLLNEFYDGNQSIIISTHQVEEIEALLSHLIFINQGKIVLESAMDEIQNSYAEVALNPGMESAAAALHPISSREILGRKTCIFKDADKESLAALGEVTTPNVSDLFVATMSGTKETINEATASGSGSVSGNNSGETTASVKSDNDGDQDSGRDLD